MADVADNDETYKRYCRLYPYSERFSRAVFWRELDKLPWSAWPPSDDSLRACHENLLREAASITPPGAHEG